MSHHPRPSVARRVTRRGAAVALTCALGLLAAVYVLSPLDAIPDVIPVVGWSDDSAVILWFLTGLLRESGRFVEWERDTAPPLPSRP